MITGYITTDRRGGLMPDSTLTIDGQTYPIPARTQAAGIFAPRRIGDAVAAAGYKPATNYYGDLGEFDGNGITIELVKVCGLDQVEDDA